MRSLLLLFLIILVIPCQAQQDSLVIKDFTGTWIQQDQDGRSFHSFEDQDINAGGIFLYRQEALDLLVKACGENFTLWVNGQMLASELSECQHYTYEDLAPAPTTDTLFLLFSTQNMELLKVELISVQEKNVRLYEDPRARQAGDYYQYWFAGFFTLTALLALLKSQNDRKYHALLSVGFNQKAETPDSAVTSSDITIMVILSALTATNKTSFGSGPPEIFDFLMITLPIFLIFCIKVILVVIAARLFALQKTVSYQLNSFFLILSRIAIAIFLIQTVAILIDLSWFRSITVFEYSVTIGSSLFTVWLFFSLYNKVPVKKLHLISYLCATEILPTFILANWLFN